VFDNATAVGCIGKFKAENLRVLLGLLEPVGRIRVKRLGLYDCDWEIAPVAEKLIQTFLRTPFHLAARDHNTAIGKTFLFAYLIVCPARSIEFRQDVAAAGIGFSEKSHL
jgi:hypothetical protein